MLGKGGRAAKNRRGRVAESSEESIIATINVSVQRSGDPTAFSPILSPVELVKNLSGLNGYL
jgi:hypothetical protein